MIAAYGSALLTLVLAAILGQGIGVLAGRRGWWHPGPAVGLAAATVVATVLVRLPAGDVVAAVVLALAAAGCVALLALRGWPRPPLPVLAVAGAALLATALPFLAHGRVGLLGVSLNNDTAVHLLWAEGFRSETMLDFYGHPSGYPLGPHALLAAIGTATATSTVSVLTGLLIALPVLLSLTALGPLARLPSLLAAPAALLVGFSYLLAAYWGQGAFKEVEQALLLFAFVAVALELADAARHDGLGALRPAAFVPLGLLAAGSLITYSYFGLGWMIGFAGIWLLAEAAAHWRAGRDALVRAARALAPGIAVAAGVVAAVALADAGRVVAFLRANKASPAQTGAIETSDLGNLAGPLAPEEVLGLWPSPDFRFAPTEVALADELRILALVAFAAALAAALLRRRLALPAALAACALIYLSSEGRQSPYVTAKALVMAAPLAAVLVYAMLIPAREEMRRRWMLPGLALAALFAAGAAWSSQAAMRWSPVESVEHREALDDLRPALGNRRTLFLGSDDYFAYRLREVPVGDITPEGPGGPLPAVARGQKDVVYAHAYDMDSVDAETLDRYDAVVLTRTRYQSQPPANFRLLARNELYEAWRRIGPTRPRHIIEEQNTPGAVLDCRERPELRRADGRALVWDAPRLVGEIPALATGAASTTELRLPPGTWELSLSYLSPMPIRVELGEQRWDLPANTNRPGPFFRVAEIRSDGRRRRPLTFIAERVSRASSGHSVAFVGLLAATRTDGRRQEVPLSEACGRYVDWYRLDGRTPE